MPTRFANITLLLTATIYLGFALWLGYSPRSLLVAFGIEQSTPEMLTEIRAFYGGVEAGIAIAMLALWWKNQIVAALLIGGIPLLGSASGRILGTMTDGFSGLHLVLASFEASGGILCLVGAYLLSKAASKTDIPSS